MMIDDIPLFFFVLDEEEKGEKITKYTYIHTYHSFLGGGGDRGLLT